HEGLEPRDSFVFRTFPCRHGDIVWQRATRPKMTSRWKNGSEKVVTRAACTRAATVVRDYLHSRTDNLEKARAALKLLETFVPQQQRVGAKTKTRRRKKRSCPALGTVSAQRRTRTPGTHSPLVDPCGYGTVCAYPDATMGDVVNFHQRRAEWLTRKMVEEIQRW